MAGCGMVGWRVTLPSSEVDHHPSSILHHSILHHSIPIPIPIPPSHINPSPHLSCYLQLMSPSADTPLGGPASVVETACPLDCPDACSLAVTVQHGKVITIDGSRKNPVTDGYICAKVRKFGQRVYGPDRLLYPAVRKGRKGEGRFKRATWEEALQLVVERMRQAKSEAGGESILPYSYGGSNGLLTQDNLDAQLWRRFGTSRLARTVCAAPTGAANMALYGKMASVTYQDYPEARMIILWGVNPSASGIHIIPFVREAQKRGATLVVIDPQSTTLARTADFH